MTLIRDATTTNSARKKSTDKGSSHKLPFSVTISTRKTFSRCSSRISLSKTISLTYCSGDSVDLNNGGDLSIKTSDSNLRRICYSGVAWAVLKFLEGQADPHSCIRIRLETGREGIKGEIKSIMNREGTGIWLRMRKKSKH